MKTGLAQRTVMALALSVPLIAADLAGPTRLKRADAFFGVHFDFHAKDTDVNIGGTTTPAMVERMIDQVQPDWVQIDSKGHPGISSYPTKVGYAAPGIVKDVLPIWREVTARRGVSLYVHHSGVADDKANATFPSWAAVKSDGSRESRATSLFGPYAEQRLIPQLRELAGTYGIDGAWVDGDCWAVRPDYAPEALARFREISGVDDAPRTPTQARWTEWMEFHRHAYRDYLSRCVLELKRTQPQFELCSNWAFTDHMPEPVSIPVDFLSGDLNSDNSLTSGRLSARYLAQQGLPWDLMSWSFSELAGYRQKSAVHLQREAAVVISQGGAFQVYHMQKRDASIYDEQMPVLAQVAAFCRARQAVVYRSRAVPQVALILSREDQYQRLNTAPFIRNLVRVYGVLNALLESQFSVEIFGEHNLPAMLANYPLIVVPECDTLEAGLRDRLSAYARAGGKLLVVGPGSARIFASELGVTLGGLATPTAVASTLVHGTEEVAVTVQRRLVTLGAGARQFGLLRTGTGTSATIQAAASISSLGAGRIAAVYFTASQAYEATRPDLLRRFMKDLARELFPVPKVLVAGSDDVEVTLATKGDKLLVNLINLSGPHQTTPLITSIAPTGPLTVSVETAGRPSRVTLEPGARAIAFTYQNGRVELTVPSVAIHDIVALTLPPPIARDSAHLSNLSVRTTLAAGQTVIVGFSMQGGAKPLLLRAVGPGLSGFGVAGAMPDPRLTLFNGPVAEATNDDWAGEATVKAAAVQVGAFPLVSAGSLDAALVRSVDGARTAHVSGATGGTVLVEAYDVDLGSTPKLVNLSARNFVGSGGDVLIAGFVITGTEPKTLLIRAVGPSLQPFGIVGVLTDPRLSLFDSSQTRIATNDTYLPTLKGTFAQVGAFDFSLGSKDAAMVVTLAPGAYTAQVSGSDGGTGVALVEVYDLP